MISGKILRDAIISGANNINNQRSRVDELNVFPVPDGDTGTNMGMTVGASVAELNALAAKLVRQEFDGKDLVFLHAKEMQVTFQAPVPWTLDGEREDGHEHITVVNKHLAYRLVQKPRESADA